MAQAIRSIPTRCLVLCRTTVDRPLRMHCCRVALRSMLAIRILRRRRSTTNEALATIAYSVVAVASTSVQSRHSRSDRVRLHQDHAQLRAKAGMVIRDWRAASSVLLTELVSSQGVIRLRNASNQSMKPTAPLRNNFNVFATTPCRGLSLSR
jgi:hypothetical protein